MSMMSEFREISEALLKRLIQDPLITEAVVYADVSANESASDRDILFSALPPKQREMMKALYADMTPEQKAQSDEMAARAAEAFRGITKDVHKRTRGESIPSEDLGERLSLEKAWHGVHYLLNGSADELPGPLGQAILGGTPIGPDMGYGPARYLDTSDVQSIAEALTAISKDYLRDQFNPEDMESANIYPGGWDDAENLEWLLEAFDDLYAFYKGVAARGNAALLYLT